MDIQALKRTSPAELQRSVMLAKQAQLEMARDGQITTICPMCKEKPSITMTTKGERTVISCSCGYIYSEEINL